MHALCSLWGGRRGAMCHHQRGGRVVCHCQSLCEGKGAMCCWQGQKGACVLLVNPAVGVGSMCHCTVCVVGKSGGEEAATIL